MGVTNAGVAGGATARKTDRTPGGRSATCSAENEDCAGLTDDLLGVNADFGSAMVAVSALNERCVGLTADLSTAARRLRGTCR